MKWLENRPLCSSNQLSFITPQKVDVRLVEYSLALCALPFYFGLVEGRSDGVDDGRVPGRVLAEVIFDPFKTTGICADPPQESPRHATAKTGPPLRQSINVNHFVLNSFQNQAFFI